MDTKRQRGACTLLTNPPANFVVSSSFSCVFSLPLGVFFFVLFVAIDAQQGGQGPESHAPGALQADQTTEDTPVRVCCVRGVRFFVLPVYLEGHAVRRDDPLTAELPVYLHIFNQRKKSPSVVRWFWTPPFLTLPHPAEPLLCYQYIPRVATFSDGFLPCSPLFFIGEMADCRPPTMPNCSPPVYFVPRCPSRHFVCIWLR